MSQFFNDNILHTFDETKIGILSISVPLTQGETGILNFDTRTIGFVPVPDTPRSALAGLVGVSLVAEWRRRRSSAGIEHSLLSR